MRKLHTSQVFNQFQKRTNSDLQTFFVDLSEIKVAQQAELSNNGPQYRITLS